MRSNLTSLLGAAALAVCAGSAAAYEAYVQTPTPLRVSPSERSAMILTMAPNAPFNVLGCRRWCQVQYGGTMGYVQAPFVVAGGPPVGPVDAPTGLLAAPVDTVGSLLGDDSYAYGAPGTYGYGEPGYYGAGDAPPVVAAY